MEHSSPISRITTIDVAAVPMLQPLRRQGLRKPGLRGITLIEMLVALVILTIITGSVYTAFDCGRNSWRVGDTMMQKYQNARGALDIMSREMVCALINDWGDSIYRLDFVGTEYSTWRGPDVPGDEIYFMARSNPSSSAKADLCEVGYYLTDEDGDGVGDVLRRFYITDAATPANFDYKFNTPSGAGAGDELASNVTGLSFRYLNSSETWTDHIWNSQLGGNEEGTLPKAVEISITVQDKKKLSDPRTFRLVVYIPGSE